VARKPSRRSTKTLYLGSHQDTVPAGGRYDGILGILVALLAVNELREVELPFNVEVIAFGDEEGTRFNSTLLGSTAVAGCFDPHILDCTDNSGMNLAEALRQFGLNPDNIPRITRNKEEAIGYLEVHIEQGPVLENHGLPVGLVSSITGIERHLIEVRGTSGHAGTVPMQLRKDALVAAGNYISWLDTYCKSTADLVGVVGKLDIYPNSVNVIPGTAELTLELRSPHKKTRRQARKELQKVTADLIEQGFTVQSELIYSLEGITCDQELTGRLESALVREGLSPLKLFSGAGHDGLAMAHLCPVAMLFVRCRDGLSHHPDESIEIDDALTAKDILKRFIEELAADF
jgi:allantoate deiminase